MSVRGGEIFFWLFLGARRRGVLLKVIKFGRQRDDEYGNYMFFWCREVGNVSNLRTKWEFCRIGGRV